MAVSQDAIRGKQAHGVAAVVEPKGAGDEVKTVGGDRAACRDRVRTATPCDVVDLPAADVDDEGIGVEQFHVFAFAAGGSRQIFVERNAGGN